MPATTGNLLLDALSSELRETVLALARPVDLPARTLLHEQGETSAHVYFLASGVASLVVAMAEGGSAEVGLIGREGVVGAMQLLGRTHTPAQSFLLMEGSALRVRLDELRALFQTSGELRFKILEFVQQQNVTLEQIAACNKLHAAEQRLARWLLMCSDRSGVETMALTQEFMADMLGTRRTTVTMVASSMQERGMIAYRRGRVTILSRALLEKAACHCYHVCREALDNLYRPHGG